mmetsp:Transcript_10354/g.18257  ORF Transcript_10354/g.18257 Transcript_10354/m.18257 type:complete len:86 (-) Transcript_10354:515-772(-)
MGSPPPQKKRNDANRPTCTGIVGLALGSGYMPGNALHPKYMDWRTPTHRTKAAAQPVQSPAFGPVPVLRQLEEAAHTLGDMLTPC